LRTGEGAGIDGVILNRTSVDPYMPKVIRSTMGSIYRVPMAVAEDLTEVVSKMRASGMRVYAAHLKGKKSYFEQDYLTDTCFMIGNEAGGLSEALADMATDYIRIPMAGQVESLNAGVAAALLMYEAKRQRMR
jgi:TrmH family RNA methyltransferase